jgi:hypothetical protein
MRLYDMICECLIDRRLGIRGERHLANGAAFRALVLDQMWRELGSRHESILRRPPSRSRGVKFKLHHYRLLEVVSFAGSFGVECAALRISTFGITAQSSCLSRRE